MLVTMIPAADYSNYTLNSDIPAADYSGYYTQAQVDQMMAGINGLNTSNPGARVTVDR